MVEWGMTSVSVSPDVIEKTREIVYEAEKKVLSKKKKGELLNDAEKKLKWSRKYIIKQLSVSNDLENR